MRNALQERIDSEGDVKREMREAVAEKKGELKVRTYTPAKRRAFFLPSECSESQRPFLWRPVYLNVQRLTSTQKQVLCSTKAFIHWQSAC